MFQRTGFWIAARSRCRVGTDRAPDLAPIVLQAPAALRSAPDPSVTIIVGVTNQGAGPALPAEDTLYLSVTPARDPFAPVVAIWSRTETIPAGGSYWLTNVVRLPAIDSGKYFLVFETDADDSLTESDILNNEAVVPIQLTLSLPPDLAMTEFQSPSLVTGPANPTIHLVWHVANQGLGPATIPWSDAVLLYTNLTSGPASVLGGFAETNAVAGGGDYWRTNTVTLPIAQSGGFYLGFRADADNEVYETDESNNGALAPITFFLTASAPLWVGGGKLNGDGSFELEVHGSSGATYTLQTSTDLMNWTGVCDFTCTHSPTRVRDRTSSNSGQRFYRVVP